jgi:hypothetical protein
VLESIQPFDETASMSEVFNMLNDETFQRSPEMTRALVSGCVSFQIPVKIGMKLVTQIASLFWSFVHVLCNVEIGTIGLSFLLISALFLCQWLRSVERDGYQNLTDDEEKIVSLLKDLIFEADPDADPNQSLAVLLLMVWANAKNDGVSIWDSTALLILRADSSSSVLRQGFPVGYGKSPHGKR